MICMRLHVCLCNRIKSQKYKKKEGKFWGATAAPIPSSSSLGARLASAFRATRYEVIEYQNGPRNLHSESPKAVSRNRCGHSKIPMSLTGEKEHVTPELNWTTTKES